MLFICKNTATELDEGSLLSNPFILVKSHDMKTAHDFALDHFGSSVSTTISGLTPTEISNVPSDEYFDLWE